MCTRTTSAWTTTSAPTSSAPPASPSRRPPGPSAPSTGTPAATAAAGTRNYIGIVTSVNCSASTARLIADQFRGRVLDAYPHVDGVVALTHDTGCGLVPTSEGAQITRRTLRGYAGHPNIAGLLVLGLGCEMIPAESLLDGLDLPADKPVTTLVIQETGGIRWTVRAGVAAIEAMLPSLDALRRTPAPVSELVLGLNCGGSDGYSGITANPALGHASDQLVAPRRHLDPRRDARGVRRRAPPAAPRGLPLTSVRSSSTGSTGGRATPRPAAGPWTTTPPPATRPAG